MYTLLLRLSAPLQAWGTSSVFDSRNTDQYPSKSGVIGMIASALGRKRYEPVDDLTKLRFGVRIDQKGDIISDFQITDMGEKYENNLSYKRYLSDALFLVGLESDDETFINNIVNAVKKPVYAMFLGRRSCPPSQPLVLGVCEKDLYQALYDEEWLVSEWRQSSYFRYSDEVRLRIIVEDKDSPSLVKDNPISFSSFNRQYSFRGIKEMKSRVIVNKKKTYDTEYDPMEELR